MSTLPLTEQTISYSAALILSTPHLPHQENQIPIVITQAIFPPQNPKPNKLQMDKTLN